MNRICQNLFRAIHEGKWLKIEYRNQFKEQTRYWIAVRDFDCTTGILTVDGLHVGTFQLKELRIHIDRIQTCKILDGTICPVNQALVDDIALSPYKYHNYFQNIPNLKILRYLAECNHMDSTPYKTEHTKLSFVDRDVLKTDNNYSLNDTQFAELVKTFQIGAEQDKQLKTKQLAVNVLSLHTEKGLYVLAYQKLLFDVRSRRLRPDPEIVICKEFTLDGQTQSIRRFLDADEFVLLDDFEQNSQQIKDSLSKTSPHLVDDAPHIMAIGFDSLLDLDAEYQAILDMFGANRVTDPIRAFFGDTESKERRKNFPIATLDRRVNLDQILAIHNAMKYPVTYVQGPPGTGKTSTILNTIITAFFNEKTVLFSTYNNHPIDGVCKKLESIPYQSFFIPFPFIRLGSNDVVKKSLRRIDKLRQNIRSLKVFDFVLEKNKEEKKARTKALVELLQNYEKRLDLSERKQSLDKLIDDAKNLTFLSNLETVQKPLLEKELAVLPEIQEDYALSLLDQNDAEFFKYLNFMSVKYLKRLEEPKFQDLQEILDIENEEIRLTAFNRFLSNGENLQRFLKIFPIVATICISAWRLGEADIYFDLTIMDEASQCNNAVSLVPILRGKSLMLVGDPQQLNPVIVLDPNINEQLKKKYQIQPEYDYIKNSIYKTFLACDPFGKELLLHCHYRCHQKIIAFNNKKYYRKKLKICSQNAESEPLQWVEIPENQSDIRNAAPREVEEIIHYIQTHPKEKIGIITPFVNQRNLFAAALERAGQKDIPFGTVHTFQGDEKDTILFSLAMTEQTSPKTYNWLKNNRELINVATSRAKNKLVLFSSKQAIKKLHRDDPDDLFDLCRYVATKGTSTVAERSVSSRALGIKPYSEETEKAFFENLNHAMDCIGLQRKRYYAKLGVELSALFGKANAYRDCFTKETLDFVIFERRNNQTLPLFALQLEQLSDESKYAVARREQARALCRTNGFDLMFVDKTYARRYHFIKEILIDYFQHLK